MKVVEFLREVGLDPVDVRDLRSVHFDPGCMTIVRFRRNENGRLYIVGDDVATVTTLVQIDNGPPSVTVRNGELRYESAS